MNSESSSIGEDRVDQESGVHAQAFLRKVLD
jgi:hypothetical protein